MLRPKITNEFSKIIQKSKFQPLRIIIVGESYCVIEPCVNFELIEFLGEQGVWTEPFLTAHRWLFRHALKINADENFSKKRAIKLAQPYWAYVIGGE